MATNHETFVLTGEQALEISVLVDFIQAYNNGLLEEALVMLSEDVVVSDCDYPEVQAVEFLGKVEAEEWLRKRLEDQDRLVVSRISNENPDQSGRHTTAVGYARRSSETLDRLGFAEGIEPALASKVVFSAEPVRIQRFANGPIGGDRALCLPAR